MSKDLQNLFSNLNQSDIEYVVPRKYSELPNISEDDVDIFFKQEDFEEGIQLCKEMGFKNLQNRHRLSFAQATSKFIRNPINSAKLFCSCPKRF